MISLIGHPRLWLLVQLPKQPFQLGAGCRDDGAVGQVVIHKFFQGGFSEDGVLHAASGDVIHFSVEEVGLFDGLDLHLALDPVGAFPGNSFLLELVGEFQPGGINDECLFLGPARIEAVNEGRFAKKEIKVFDALQFCFERVVGVNRKVGRDDGKFRTCLAFRSQEVRDASSRVVVPKP